MARGLSRSLEARTCRLVPSRDDTSTRRVPESVQKIRSCIQSTATPPGLSRPHLITSTQKLFVKQRNKFCIQLKDYMRGKDFGPNIQNPAINLRKFKTTFKVFRDCGPQTMSLPVALISELFLMFIIRAVKTQDTSSSTVNIKA